MSLVLIIEDSRAMAEAADRKLREAGYETVNCLTLADAVSFYQERKPDLVVMEYYIGNGTSLTFLEKMARPEPPVPIVVSAGCGSEEIAAKVMAAGAWAYVVKSESYLAELPALVHRVLTEWSGRLHAREKRRLVRRLEAQNEMAEWLAHNFKNILAASIGYLNLINLKNPDQPRERQMEYLKDSRESQESAIILLEQLIRMTDSEGGEAERIIVAEVVDEAWETAKSKVLKNTAAQYPERLAETRIRIGEVVFLNSARRLEPLNMVRADLASIMEALIQNALEAVEASADPRILVLGEIRDHNLEITVRDNGRGMSESVLKHALEPMFSTKGEVGVGVSLSLVSSLVIRHGGDMDLKSTPGVGTTIKINFPL